jgi:hypothetical protein
MQAIASEHSVAWTAPAVPSAATRGASQLIDAPQPSALSSTALLTTSATAVVATPPSVTQFVKALTIEQEYASLYWNSSEAPPPPSVVDAHDDDNGGALITLAPELHAVTAATTAAAAATTTTSASATMHASSSAAALDSLAHIPPTPTNTAAGDDATMALPSPPGRRKNTDELPDLDELTRRFNELRR